MFRALALMLALVSLPAYSQTAGKGMSATDGISDGVAGFEIVLSSDPSFTQSVLSAIRAITIEGEGFHIIDWSEYPRNQFNVSVITADGRIHIHNLVNQDNVISIFMVKRGSIPELAKFDEFREALQAKLPDQTFRSLKINKP